MTLTDDEKQGVTAELERARAALSAGNDGKARVCARRAAGIALRAFYLSAAGEGWKGDTVSLLLKASGDPGIPADARSASLRLTTPVTRKDTAPFSTDPIADARLIVSTIDGQGA
jgi:hypothetical protein